MRHQRPDAAGIGGQNGRAEGPRLGQDHRRTVRPRRQEKEMRRGIERLEPRRLARAVLVEIASDDEARPRRHLGRHVADEREFGIHPRRAQQVVRGHRDLAPLAVPVASDPEEPDGREPCLGRNGEWRAAAIRTERNDRQPAAQVAAEFLPRKVGHVLRRIDDKARGGDRPRLVQLLLRRDGLAVEVAQEPGRRVGHVDQRNLGNRGDPVQLTRRDNAHHRVEAVECALVEPDFAPPAEPARHAVVPGKRPVSAEDGERDTGISLERAGRLMHRPIERGAVMGIVRADKTEAQRPGRGAGEGCVKLRG